MNLRTTDVAICAQTSPFTIRELSDWGLLGPVSRTESGSYRQFDPRVIPVAHLWLKLKDYGLSQQELRELGQSRTPEVARTLFRRYSDRLSTEIASLQSSVDMLESFTAMIEEGQAAPDGIEAHTLPAQPIRVSSVEPFESRVSSRLSIAERQRRAFLQLNQGNGAFYPLGFAYLDFADLLARREQPAQFIAYDPNGTELRPAGKYLIGTEHCCYEESSTLPQRMFEYARDNSLEFAGTTYTVSLLDAASVTKAEQFVFQVVAGIS